jgi:hypothetical protein
MVRLVLAVIGGAVVGSAFNMAIIMLSWVVYPLPAGMDTSDPATMKTYVASLPMPAFLLILLAHAGGAFVGGLVAAWVGRRFQPVLGGIIGALFLVGGAVSMISIPCPVWFAIADLLSYVPSGVVGAMLAPRPSAVPAASAGG